ncbi:helix-turn-helix domain-containing protein [Paenibacillus sp. IHBB 3054]|uniref:helix-turn-helix domain-containing protein n=1 Tax=Paenibacillus sp. IHBB 3054 TaxID=3425689 RepID=UPI003F667FEB
MFSSRLFELRKNSHLTQNEISKKLGIARTTYASYEQGNREPDLQTLEKIADYFDVDADFLLGRSDERKKELESGVTEGSNYHKLQRFAKRFSEHDLEKAVKILDAAFEDAFSENDDDDDL